MKTIFKVWIFIILVMLAGCELNEEVIRNEKYAEKIKIRESSLDVLLGENKFVAAYNKVYATRDKSRTVMEQQYNFTIVPYGAKVIDDGNNTSYTFKITREINNPDYFENLVINVDSLGQTSAYILKYTPSEPLAPAAHNSFNFKGQVKITPIVYNTTETGKTTICVTAQILMCDQAWSSTNTGVHVATNDCQDQNHLFYSPVTTCYTVNGDIGGGDFGDDPVVIAPIGGGGGDPPAEGTPPNNCHRCPVIITAPVEEWVEPPLHCEKLNELLKSFNFKEAIKKLKTEQALTGVKEQGYNLSYNAKGNLVVSEVPEANTGENNVNYSTFPLVFGGIHCHLNGHFSLFSGADLFLLEKFYQRHNYVSNGGVSNPLIPVHLLVSNMGVYAISADNVQAMEKLREIYSNNKKRESFVRALEKNYQKIDNSSFALANYQKIFLEFLKDNGLQLSLYKADDNLTKWTKLALNDNPETNTNKPINEITCN
ncbi:hypothetical protein MUB18_06725 [Sphingobacterium sp. PCS056]|uniref:hypothetical protein n=1 Tax=Sphingobacterium sp. PCS056 TaxID=2931400 RepID=UPI002010799A|nr:hypothetical protein [Sphingobacterium sp. PCS056]UPZ37991.1 hypothetical protein MUB18_06725 [Sphingobacterium sp. PCS056]